MTSSAADHPILHWSFNDAKDLAVEYGEETIEAETREEVTGTACEIFGQAKFVPGVSGTALKFDGFSSFVEATPEDREQSEEDTEEEADGIEMPREITIEAWVALETYPWNWTPILTIGKHKITGFYFGIDARGRLGFHVSDATSVWHECNSSIDPGTALGLSLYQWHHVAGTYSPRQGLAVYIDGKPAGTYNDFQFDYGIVYSELERGFRIGKNRVDLPPAEPIRDWATYPSRYTLDGIIDELKVHRGAMTSQQVVELYKSSKPDDPPLFKPRRFPTVKPSGRFGAHYTRLEYYPEWDALWPGGEHLDVVVQFDKYPTKLMFWRGTRYSACWVSENGKWMADQSRETGNNWFLQQGSRDEMPTGCIEHMSDTQCRSSRVSIIESNEARCVVNWRYLQMDVRFRQNDLPNETGFGEWGNEYYYVYPDGLCVRKVLAGYGGWQETIFLNEPGTRPEDNVELEACTLVNLSGESKTYSWEHGYPEFDLDDAVIQMTNFKSRFKPFMVFREESGFDVFNLEVRPEYSHFPWWNHWPVAQVISDGRSAIAPDRASHSSLSWGNPKGNAALYGMTDQPAESLVDLARSWNSPPSMRVLDSAYTSKGYDYQQRAYVLRANQPNSPMKLEFTASEGSPIVNLALVVTNWDENELKLTIDGEEISRGTDFRYAVEYDVEGRASLIVWIKKRAKKRTIVTLIPTD